MKVGIIGAGRIIPFHLQALSAAGFDLSFIAARPNSSSAIKLAREYGISNVLDTRDQILKQTDSVDCLLVAPSSEVLFDFLELLLPIGIPMLVEKPLFRNEHQIAIGETLGALSSKVMIGYNRRFYKSVLQFKTHLQSLSGGFLGITIPELSGLKKEILQDDGVGKRAINTLIDNTVHMLDLLYFLLPNVHFHEKMIRVRGTKDFRLLEVTSYEREIEVRIEVTFGIPGNYVVCYRGAGLIMELKPLEVYRRYEGLDVVEPTEDFPIRRYVPRLVDETFADLNPHGDVPLKPGFFEQANAFKKFVETGQLNHASSIDEAIRVSKLSLALVKSIRED
jgi:predicted dehydrogenase